MNKTIPMLAMIWLLAIGIGLRDQAARASDAQPTLQAGDCIKCHEAVVEDFDQQGATHRDRLTCTDCHRQHSPRGNKSIPACSLCHASVVIAHFNVDDCLGCHSAHHPAAIDLNRTDAATPACRSCHPIEDAMMSEHPNRHAELDCRGCHQQHGAWQGCLQCHRGHDETMVEQDCGSCHNPHKPLEIEYDSYLPSSFCAACHGGQMEAISGTGTSHQERPCVFCHRDRHKRIPRCDTCHGQPHGAKIHAGFTGCSECHQGPHDLLN